MNNLVIKQVYILCFVVVVFIEGEWRGRGVGAARGVTGRDSARGLGRKTRQSERARQKNETEREG